MEEEIDLRSYIDILLRHWKWIVGLALGAAVLVFVVSSLQPATYEASSVVLVAQPRYQMRFDPRFETSQTWKPAYEAFPTLATSDGFLQEVVDAYAPPIEAAIDDWRLIALSEMTRASSGGDPSLVVLTVRSRSPQASAAIANLWADILTQRGNELYGGSAEEVAFFAEQTAQAEQALGAVDSALIEFEARNQSSIVTAQLESQRQAQTDYLDAQRTIAYTSQDIQGLRDQLTEQPGNETASAADSLTALLLQIKAFNAQGDAPITLQIENGESLSNRSPAEQFDFLDDLVATLEAKSAEIDVRLEALEPQILVSQQRLQEISVEYDRLALAQELARETYLTLARKLDEAHIAAQEENGTLQVGSYAAVPHRPVGPRRLFNTAVVGMLALMAGILGVFAIEFWRQDGTQGHTEEE